MNRFEYIRTETVQEAVKALSSAVDARALAGGTNLIDLMKYNVAKPSLVVDINRLPLKKIETGNGGNLRIGALVTNTGVAWDSAVEKDYPLLSSAILAGASPQLRNAATTGGNPLQRTRCSYFYDPSTPCNKREPGSGCSALEGVNRNHAILGTSDVCIATHPSDMCVALRALDAVVHVTGPEGDREIPFAEFHRLPERNPENDNTMKHGEIIVAIELPQAAFQSNYSYLKIRDRLSYAFALVSVAAALNLEGGTISTARVALGGVAHKPWRDEQAEKRLEGKPANDTTFEAFASDVLSAAKGRGNNDFKIELARKAIVRAMRQAAAGTPQSQTDKKIH